MIILLKLELSIFFHKSGKKKASKKLEEKIAEKERKAREEAEQREATLSPEDKLAEKLKRQKLVIDSDFALAQETFGEFQFSLDCFK